MANIVSSVERKPRTVDVILYYPLPEFKKVVRKYPFRKINKIRVPGAQDAREKFIIYRLEGKSTLTVKSSRFSSLDKSAGETEWHTSMETGSCCENTGKATMSICGWVNNPKIVDTLSDIFLYPHSEKDTRGILTWPCQPTGKALS